jgi:hypothetical protein
MAGRKRLYGWAVGGEGLIVVSGFPSLFTFFFPARKDSTSI